MMNKIKLILAIIVLSAGVVLFYKLPVLMQVVEVSILLRVGVVLVSVILALLIALSSDYGKRLFAFLKGARTELRKMVWPTKAETSQSTMIVAVTVIIIGLFLWVIDLGVVEVVYDLLLGLDT